MDTLLLPFHGLWTLYCKCSARLRAVTAQRAVPTAFDLQQIKPMRMKKIVSLIVAVSLSVLTSQGQSSSFAETFGGVARG